MKIAPLDDLDGLLLVHNPRIVQLLEEARQRVHVEGGIALDELRRRLAAAEITEEVRP